MWGPRLWASAYPRRQILFTLPRPPFPYVATTPPPDRVSSIYLLSSSPCCSYFQEPIGLRQHPIYSL